MLFVLMEVIVIAIMQKLRMQNVDTIIVLSVIKEGKNQTLFVLIMGSVIVIIKIHRMQHAARIAVLFATKTVQHLSHSVRMDVPVWQNKERFCHWTLKGWEIPNLFL